MHKVSGKKIWINIYSSNIHVILSFMVIWDVYRSLIWNKTTFIKYCLTRWISKVPGIPVDFKAPHWVRLYLKNFMGLAGIVITVYKNEQIFTGLGLRNCPIENGRNWFLSGFRYALIFQLKNWYIHSIYWIHVSPELGACELLHIFSLSKGNYSW